MHAALRAPVQDLKLDPGDRAVWRDVNRSPFLFRHRLAHHPLFAIPRLARLAEIAIDSGGVDRYASEEEKRLSKPERTRRMIDNISRLDEGDRWLKVSAVNRLDPEYDELMQSLLAEVEDLAESPIRSQMTWAGMDVFMNSPHLRVPYHFDHDTNFLMQIRGEKDVYLFDPSDRSVLTEAEIEDFYRGNKLAGRYRDAIKDAGKRHHLSPGVGVHHPPLAPHLILNGSEISISVACYFILPGQERVARVYQSNHFMRKLGIRPRPPGQSMLADWAKNNLIKALSTSNPASYDERLYSGVNRLASPSRLARRVAGMLRSH
jgi:hypothetical protein